MDTKEKIIYGLMLVIVLVISVIVWSFLLSSVSDFINIVFSNAERIDMLEKEVK